MACEVAEIVSAVSDAIVAIAAIAAAVFAYIGLTAWKKQLKGGAEYQLAKEVLKAVYRVREAFKVVRNPAIFSYEYPEEMRSPSGNLKPEHRLEGTEYVYKKRWEDMAASFKELEELHLQAQVEWGPQFQERIVKLRHCRIELQMAIADLLEGYSGKRKNMSSSQESREVRSVLYWTDSDEHDKFTPQINEAISEFEGWLRPKVSE